jgi:hypothetical protein
MYAEYIHKVRDVGCDVFMAAYLLYLLVSEIMMPFSFMARTGIALSV